MGGPEPLRHRFNAVTGTTDATGMATLPLAKGVKYTENGQQLPMTQGLWATATRDATYRLYAADQTAGEVGFLGVMKENNQPVFIVLRLKVTDGKTTHTEVAVLDAEQRIDELSRMLGGVEITERARAHAAEMIDRAAR